MIKIGNIVHLHIDLYQIVRLILILKNKTNIDSSFLYPDLWNIKHTLK